MDAIGDRAPRALLLTHIHLDHAGATGALVRAFPDLRVYVHELGAPHLIDPSKLLRERRAALRRGDMDRMWGEIVPVPEENIAILRGGETVEGFRVAYTPGHASHHVAYLHEDSGWAFTGDVAGVRIAPRPAHRAADAAARHRRRGVAAVDRRARRRGSPSALALTHFGAYEDVAAHLDTLRAALRKQADWVRDLDEPEFRARRRAWVDDAPVYEQAAPSDQMWQGLERYWRKRAERDAA